MALGYYRVAVTDDTVLGAIGVDRAHSFTGPGGGDPFRSFVGDPNGSEIANTGYGTYWTTITGAAARLGMSAAAAGSIPPGDVYQWVLMGHPAVTWTTFDWQVRARKDYTAYDGASIPYAGPDEHTVVVVGVNSGQVLVNDPDRGQYWISRAQFEGAFSVYGDMAVIL
jgi:uncharacterized protein YvpB